MKRYAAASALVLLSVAGIANAQISLQAEKTPPPGSSAWEQPATLGYTRNGDGSSNTTIDAYLSYTDKRNIFATSADETAKRDSFNYGVYVHRNNASSTPLKDQGISFGYARALVFDTDNSKGPQAYAAGVKISAGTSLQEVEQAGGTSTFESRNKDRESVYFSGYYHPPLAGIPGSSTFVTQFINWETRLYSDNTRGGNLKGQGRINGAMVAATYNWIPLGADSEGNTMGHILGVGPVFSFSGQVQRDASASDGRKKETRRLYSASLVLEFQTEGRSGKLKPSMSFTRTVGADLLTGRPYEGKTEVMFGLTF